MSAQDPAGSLRLGIDGMHCAGCAKRVAEALETVPGVRQASVNPADDGARLELDFRPNPAALIAAVSAAGYAIKLEPIRLDIAGLGSPDDAVRVERALADLPGTAAVRVSLGGGSAALESLAALVPKTALIEAVARAGFAAEIAAIGAARRGPLLWPVLAASALTVPLLLPMLGVPNLGAPMLPAWLALLLGAPIQFGLGARFYRSAWLALKAGAGTMDQLIVLATNAAWGLSLWNLLSEPTPILYLEPAAAIVSFVLLGKYLEARARLRAGDAIAALAALQPATAIVLREGARLAIPIEALERGDLMLVEPGGRVGADGVIRSGHASFDQAHITGETRSVMLGPGDAVAGGALNLDGAVTIEATGIGEHSMLARIIRLVDAAQTAKAPIQRLADRVSGVFVPVILAAAAITLASWRLAGLGWDCAVLHAVAVLVVACPCALGLATPIVLVVAVGQAARRGILIKDPAALERARAIDFVAFDKTGTLTEGRPALVEIATAGMPEDESLSLAGALQRHSEHPLAPAIRDALAERGLDAPSSSDFRALPGIGIRAEIGGQRYSLVGERGIAAIPPALQPRHEALAARGCTISWLLRDDAVLALFGFADRMRDEAPDTVARLKALGIEIGLLTGDSAGSAALLARACGIERHFAQLLPAEKAARIEAWRRDGHVVAMVGDGINDAPSLAAADLGVALSTGTEVAIAAAGAIILGNHPARLVELIALARRCWRIMIENLVWAFGFNVVAVPLAALGLLTPELAAAAMAASSLAVVGNALRLGRQAGRDQPCQTKITQVNSSTAPA
jgi:P-type Cu+ transporter